MTADWRQEVSKASLLGWATHQNILVILFLGNYDERIHEFRHVRYAELALKLGNIHRTGENEPQKPYCSFRGGRGLVLLNRIFGTMATSPV